MKANPVETGAPGNAPVIVLLILVLLAIGGIGYYAFFSGPPAPSGPPKEPATVSPGSSAPEKTNS